ncbi:MAG TPA: hypothetical protein P5509_11525 [Bacteroidales bacterium]|jgi:hypothetical protein|nr:hypothetical protein [Bacteroidales bacterium]
MIGIITYKASNLGFSKDPNLEKTKVPNLGCELSLENGIMCENVAKYGLFE